ncbi:MAG: substrate-binding domain-containing protein [Anaerolineae bacterium]|nr:substrate-binding domain-containing protein [Thermoflexales bacterium]MDW8407659.1 substrate-binding domain-containing protein [Anaerolineae bacterium]
MADTQQPLLLPRKRRLRIGLLIPRLDRGFHRTAWLSVAETATRHGVDVVCFDGGVLAPDDEFARKSNTLYDLISPKTMDGLLVWSSCLDWSVQPSVMQAFCERFRPLPLVSIGRVLKGFPSVVVDNYQGMCQAVMHLIEAHGYRRIAFLRGPTGNYEEVLRYQAYVDTLQEHGIPLDPQLISTHTTWERADGAAMIHLLLDERGLQPGRDFQALVSVGDDMACGAMEALLARGVRVPDDVAVVGFNDDLEGRAMLPSLTTVRQPVSRIAACATELLLALLRGEPPAEQTVLPLKLVIRQSCGCVLPATLGAPSDMTQTEDFGDALQSAQHARVAEAFWQVVLARTDSDRCADFSPFLTAFNEVLRQTAAAGGDVLAWRVPLLEWARRAMRCLSDMRQRQRAEDALEQAQALISEMAVQAERYRSYQAEREAHHLSQASQSLATAADVRSVLDMMAHELPRAGVRSCYLSLYTDPNVPTDSARLVLAYTASGRLELPEGGLTFPAQSLIPPHLWAEQGMPPLLALPLYFRERALGFALFELREGALAGSETLRQQVSGALEGALLREDLARAWQQAEQANQLKSRFLAMVSHELRTPLSLIVGTIEMLQRESAAEKQVHDETWRRDLARIHTAAQHLSRLIGDVLDLSSSQVGELRLSCENLRLDALLNEAAMLAEPMVVAKGLVWAYHPPSAPLRVWGDRKRLQQVILNLVSNAVKFTQQGFVTLWVEQGKNQVMIAVSDTGIGVPPAEQEIIFDEFRQTERSARRGYGGMGLGLAISKRLVELHGGQIGVISSGADGAGSTFFFTLPVMPAEHNLPVPSQNRASVVLVLTEQAAAGARVRQHLIRRGYAVEMLVVTPEADWLTQVLMAPPGAIVLDAEPAAERGWQLVQALKQNPATCDIPVVFYSLSAEGGAGNLFMVDYLGKPVSEEALAQALERHQMTDEAGKRRTILIVEDDPDIQELHARIVRARVRGCRVIRVSNGAEALGVMSTTTPDLVLLDLMMPQMDGFAVLERMRQDRRLRAVPVIVLTAQMLSSAEMARLQRGVVAVLRKELFSEAEVLAQVEAALTHSKRLGGEARRIARLAMAYIHEHYAESISRETLAAAVGVSERYLTRCFKQETGITPVVYLNRYRVRQACRLLESGEISVTEVAMACGFGDSTYFGKVFRAETGVSPRAWQRGLRAPAGAALAA